MEYPVSLTIQIILAVMATIAAIASAIAAWKVQTTASNALEFQKKLSKHQDSLFLLRSTISSLWQLKRILEEPLAAGDDEFGSFDNIHTQIGQNLESLIQAGVIQRRSFSFFAARSRAQIVDRMPFASQEIDIEIKRLEAKINEIFS